MYVTYVHLCGCVCVLPLQSPDDVQGNFFRSPTTTLHDVHFWSVLFTWLYCFLLVTSHTHSPRWLTSGAVTYNGAGAFLPCLHAYRHFAQRDPAWSRTRTITPDQLHAYLSSLGCTDRDIHQLSDRLDTDVRPLTYEQVRRTFLRSPSHAG